MLRIFSLLLLSLVLLTTACQKKDDPQPTPTLEGRWELQSAYIRYYNAADGTLIQDGKVSLPATAEELLITNAELQFPTTFFGNTPGFYFSKLPYARQADTLTVTSPALSSYRHPPFVITELTTSSLELGQSARVTLLSNNNQLALRVVGGRYARKQ